MRKETPIAAFNCKARRRVAGGRVDSSAMPSAREDRRLALRLGAAVTLFLLLVGQAQVTVLDGSSMLAVAQSVVHHGSLSVPPELGVAGDGGRFYSKYGLLLPLLSVLPVALVQPIGAITGRVDLLEAAVAASLMPLVTGALAAWLFALGRRLGAPRPAAALVAVGIVLGTYLLPYGRDFFTEPLVALGLVAMIERALAGRELQAGAALAFAVLARPQSAVFVPLLWAFLALHENPGLLTARGRAEALRAILRTLGPLALAAVLTVAYNLARFGDPLEFGYEPPVDPGFTTPLHEGAAGLLFSPEKSLRALRAGDRARAGRARRARSPAAGGRRAARRAVRRVVRARGDLALMDGGLELGAAPRHPRRRRRARGAGAVDRRPRVADCGSRARCSRSASSCRCPRSSRRPALSCSTATRAPTARRSSVRCASSRS